MTSIPASWSAALEVRAGLPGFQDTTAALRLLHTEDPYVRCDRFGSVCWFYWYHLDPPDPIALSHIAAFSSRAGASDWMVRYMQNRGSDPHLQSLWQSRAFSNWLCTEHDISYQLRADQGLSPGLFLDQANNRKWLLENATDARVLNLFSYTGGFGLCAAKGGARQVVNVDTSKNTLAWAKENANRNRLEMEFVAMDAREFLKRARKQNRVFDRIVCDPPSFARSKQGIWKIEKDLPDLIRLITPLLASNGLALISSNFEGWSYKRFSRLIAGVLPDGLRLKPGLELPASIACAPSPDLLKNCFIERSS